MTPALIGFLGVIAGGLITGGVGFVNGWRERARARRTAARLIYGDLLLAASDMNGYLNEAGGWPDDAWVLPMYVEAWRRHADAFSLADAGDFNIVAVRSVD